MMDIVPVLLNLAQKRPVFHIEADFQHALAWTLHEAHPTAEIRLERVAPNPDERNHIDICARVDEDQLFIELKYKTRGLKLTLEGETFDLQDQAAQVVSRYDFFKDIQRLEQAVWSQQNSFGYAILLTNDSAYWKGLGNNMVYEQFATNEGRKLEQGGKYDWKPNTSPGTKRGREEAIHIKGEYRFHWQDYSKPSQDRYGEFRFLLVGVSNHPTELTRR